jgi:hypothetical protein
MMPRKVGSISARQPSSQGISNGVPSSKDGFSAGARRQPYAISRFSAPDLQGRRSRSANLCNVRSSWLAEISSLAVTI